MPSTFEVIHPNGVLDATQASQLRDHVNEIIGSEAKTILVNLKDVNFMDSSGLAALVIALKTVRSAGGQLCICSLNDQVRMLFELTSMTKVFDIFADQEEFVQSRQQS